MELTDTTLIEKKEIRLHSERSVLYNSMKELIEQAVHTKNITWDETGKTDCNDERELPVQVLRMDQTEYNEKYENLKNQYDKIKEKLSKIEDLKFETRTKKYRTEEFIESLKQSSELPTDFGEKLWYALIGKATVNSDSSMNFKFKNGTVSDLYVLL